MHKYMNKNCYLPTIIVDNKISIGINEDSNLCQIDNSVPQGSGLRPILFFHILVIYQYQKQTVSCKRYHMCAV